MTLSTFLMQDFPVLTAGVLASLACALVGSFLVLRRMSLMGDAISHAVLPGIVIAFLIHGSLSGPAMFIGAAVVGVLTAALSELVHRLGRVEPGAAMGVVFTVLFALGVIMLELTGGRSVHLDAECVLYGAMETVLWTNPPTSFSAIFQLASWHDFPSQVVALALVLLADVAFITILFKELRLASFDPGLAAAQGINPHAMHYLLMTFVAMTTVAAFSAVGSILVVAMLIVPGVIAHLLCDRLGTMLVVAAIIGAFSSTLGYVAAAQLDVNAAGMIGVTLGVMLAIAAVFAPRFGWLARRAARELQMPVEDSPSLAPRKFAGLD